MNNNILHRIKYSFLSLLIGLCCVSCETDEMFPSLSREQKDLLGTGINFDATVVDPFYTRASWADLNGNFSIGEEMVIYRQYWTGSEFGEEAYRQYKLNQKYATGTNIYLGDPNWLPIAGRTGGNWDATQQKTVGFSQTDADSLTWDNDKTVRFRAIGRSNYAGCIGSERDYYYADFTLSDWVTVSGPTTEIPFVMKHLGSRIVFSPKTESVYNGNVIQKVEISVDPADYARNDNSTTQDQDKADKTIKDENGNTLTEQQAADKVKAVYNRMCMPAGVDKETGLMLTMTKEFYKTASAADFQKILEKPILGNSTVTASTTDRITFGSQSSDNISTFIQRPAFTKSLNTIYSFLVTIPYDMSNNTSTQGEVLVLPPYTRFRVWIYDTNSGDGTNSKDQSNTNVSKTEGSYHILSLSDFGDTFKDGMELSAGRSYQFKVGYQYDKLVAEVTPTFSWVEQDLTTLEGSQVNTDPALSDEPYKWWKDAIDKATQDAISTSGDYKPVFEIKTPQQFLEFINLVNGTATNMTSGLYQANRTIYNLDGTVNKQKSGYWWYTSITAEGDTLWTTSEAMATEGYIFYNQYFRSVGDNKAEARETYLKGPYSFYDASFGAFKVILSEDLDMDDWMLASIGTGTGATFMGDFDGQNHTISNLYMEHEYLFDKIAGADIRNLRLTSTHNLALVNEAKGSNYIIGISLKANSTGSSIAKSIIGKDDQDRLNSSYVVGCIHEGTAGAGMIGKADDLFMYGCMETGGGIPTGTGALLKEYYDSNNKFFAPQSGKYAEWGRFMCNYYNIETSPGTYAAVVSGVYKAQEYIRGVKTHVLKAVTDYMLPDNMPYNKLSDEQKREIYGLAPWKAMNYGIYKYNSSSIGEKHPCTLHYENNATGYANRYPQLINVAPGTGQYANVLDQNN